MNSRRLSESASRSGWTPLLTFAIRGDRTGLSSTATNRERLGCQPPPPADVIVGRQVRGTGGTRGGLRAAGQ